ncbi:MAG: succinyl-CoA--3-ketoacid-CoA transferase, partial [Phycisphaerales bacterium]
KVVVTMEHNAKNGDAKILKACTLPLTGTRCIDMVITDLCVLKMDAEKRRFRVLELAPGVTLDEVQAKTEAELLTDQQPAVVQV